MLRHFTVKILLIATLAFAASCANNADSRRGSIKTDHLRLNWENQLVTVHQADEGQSWQFDLASGIRTASGTPQCYEQEWSIDFGMDENPVWDAPGPELTTVEQTGPLSVRYNYKVSGTAFSVEFRLLEDAPELEVVVSADTSGAQVVAEIEAPGDCRPASGEITSFYAPYMQGIVWKRNLEAAFTQHFRVFKRIVGLSMPFYLVNSGEDWMMCTFRTPDDAALSIYKEKNREPSLTPRFYRSLKSMHYRRKMVYRFEHGAGYPALCKVYRDRFARPDGHYKTFAQKAAERPLIKKALGAPYIFIGVSEQKPDTIMAVLDTLKAMGFDHGLVVSTGYYNPAEKATKAFVNRTINEYPQLSDPIRRLGYLPVAWLLVNHYAKDCENYSTNKVAHSAGGKLIKCWRIGPKLEWQALRPDLIIPKMRQEEQSWISLDGFHFDTGASSGLYEMFTTDGKAFTRGDDRRTRTEYFKYTTDRGKINLSEGAQSWCVPYLDVGSVHGFGEWLEPGFEYDLLPLWHLVFHDCVQGAWHEGKTYQDGQFRKKFLYDMSWGTPPTIGPLLKTFSYNARNPESEMVPLVHSILRPEDSRYKEQIRESVQVYRFARAVAGERMTDHRFLDGANRRVARSEFSNGKVVHVNFGKEAFTLPDGRKLDGEGWLVD